MMSMAAMQVEVICAFKPASIISHSFSGTGKSDASLALQRPREHRNQPSFCNSVDEIIISVPYELQTDFSTADQASFNLSPDRSVQRSEVNDRRRFVRNTSSRFWSTEDLHAISFEKNAETFPENAIKYGVRVQLCVPFIQAPTARRAQFRKYLGKAHPWWLRKAECSKSYERISVCGLALSSNSKATHLSCEHRKLIDQLIVLAVGPFMRLRKQKISAQR
eukprot:2713661-Pleurochrysis_carterae.AAC.1